MEKQFRWKMLFFIAYRYKMLYFLSKIEKIPLTTHEEITKATTSDEIIDLINVLLLVIFVEGNLIKQNQWERCNGVTRPIQLIFFAFIALENEVLLVT